MSHLSNKYVLSECRDQHWCSCLQDRYPCNLIESPRAHILSKSRPVQRSLFLFVIDVVTLRLIIALSFPQSLTFNSPPCLKVSVMHKKGCVTVFGLAMMCDTLLVAAPGMPAVVNVALLHIVFFVVFIVVAFTITCHLTAVLALFTPDVTENRYAASTTQAAHRRPCFDPFG